ncbi:MAG TPA: restriction endonuclease [Pirellulales bacterium]|nr:restriction endonuclease [Pirellulales bacterium]
MVKAGKAYNELAQMMAAALEPKATVKMGQWIEGPDGKREVDVEVRGSPDEQAFFLLIECKDWKAPVDIEEIDKLDSKRKDLSADRIMICSNSGFTKKALRKASRLGIDAVSVLACGNELVKLRLTREYVAKRLSVDQWSLDLFPGEKSEPLFAPGGQLNRFDARDLRYAGLPVANWLHSLSADLLRENEGVSNIVATFAFKQAVEFAIDGVAVELGGIRLRIACSRKWFSRVVSEDVSLGYFDWIRQFVIVPDKECWAIGPFSSSWDGWQEVEEPDDYDADAEEGAFRLRVTMMNAIPKKLDEAVPSVGDLIGESCVETT